MEDHFRQDELVESSKVSTAFLKTKAKAQAHSVELVAEIDRVQVILVGQMSPDQL